MNLSEQSAVRLAYPLWVKLVTLVGIPLLLASSGYLLWLMVVGFDKLPIIAVPAFLLLGGFPLYMTIVSLRALPYLNSEILLTDVGIEVQQGDRPARFYPWHMVGEVKHFATSSIVDIYSRDGDRVVAVGELISGYTNLTYFLDTYVGTDLSGTKMFLDDSEE